MAVATKQTTYPPNSQGGLLISAGFEEVVADKAPNYRLIICSRAKEKHGKTHFSLTSPGNIAYLNYDKGEEGVMEKFLKDRPERKIYTCELPKPLFRKRLTGEEAKKREEGETKLRLEQYDKYWLKGRDAFEAAATNPLIKTIVVDTCTEFYESVRLARFGKLTEVMPQHYGPVKSEFRDVVRMAFDRKDLNVIFVHKMKKEYQENSAGKAAWTGRLEMQGFEDMGYIAQVTITHLREKIPSGGVKFGIRIDDCRINPDVIGLELWSDDGMCDFANLGMVVYPDSTQEDWE